MDDMPDTDADVDEELDADDVIDDGAALDSDDDDDAEDASLDDLYESELVAEEEAAGGSDDDDEYIAKALETPGDDPAEALAFKVRPKADGEFQCQSCFLIKQGAQLADRKRMWCVDCV